MDKNESVSKCLLVVVHMQGLTEYAWNVYKPTDRPTDSNCTELEGHKNFFLADYNQSKKACTSCNFHAIWLCNERHGMYMLWVDSCSRSCHFLTKGVFLKLIKSYIYQATFLHCGFSSCLCSNKITKKYHYSLYVLTNVQVTDIYGRGEGD
jgi:hypothetical protein